MKKQTIAIIFGIALIGLVSALYGGECIQVDLGNLTSVDNVMYSVVGNSSNLNGMNITLDGTTANICFVQNFKPDNFTLIFLDNSTKEVIKEIHHYSSSSGRTKYIYENITKLVPFETIKYVNQTIEVQSECPEVEKKVNFVNRIWNWIINLFKGKK